MSHKDGVKLAAAVVILAAAGVLICWNLGVFDAAPAPVNPAEANRPHPGGGARVLEGGR
jgi:hypothetical protein